MEPEIKPARPSRNYLWPLALLGTLVFASWFTRHTKALHPQDSTGETSNQGENNTAIIPDGVPAPPKNQKTRTTCRPDQTPWWKTLGEGVALFGGIGLLIVNIFQMKATQSAADTAHDSLVLGNRPWIKIKHRIVKPLNFDFVGAAGPASTMTVEDTFDNVGSGVALNVVSWEDVIPIDPDFSTASARKRRDEWCNANKRFDPDSRTVLNGTIMFPKDPITQLSGMGPLMTTVNKAVESNMEPLRRFVRGAGPNTLLGKVQFVMVGCVVYRSSFEPDGTRPHMTGFLYHLGEPNGAGIQPFVTAKGTADKLQLVKFPDGDFAY